jgi:hypothetical protein
MARVYEGLGLVVAVATAVLLVMAVLPDTPWYRIALPQFDGEWEWGEGESAVTDHHRRRHHDH